MKTTIIVFVVLCGAYVALSAPQKGCARPCPLVSCLRVTPNDCRADEIFVRRDGCRYCCDQCVKKRGKCI